MSRRIFAAMTLGVLAACSVSLDGYSGGPANDGGAPPPMTPDATAAPDSGSAEAAAPVCVLPPGTDVKTDPHHCGVCGRDCLGGECKSGKCQSAVIAENLDDPLGIALGGNKLYVASKSGIDEMELDGSNRHSVVSDLYCRYVVATDSDIFFSEVSNGAIRHWSKSKGGMPNVVVGNLNTPLDLALATDHLYFTQYTDPSSSGGLYSVTYPGLADMAEVFPFDHDEGVDWRDGTLWIGSDGPANEVLQIDPDGTRHPLVQGGGPVDISVQGDSIFVSQQGGGNVLQVALDGSNTTVLAEGQQGPSGIVATPTAVYWVEEGAADVRVLVR